MACRHALPPLFLAALAACSAAPGGVAESPTDRAAAPPAPAVVIAAVGTRKRSTSAAHDWEMPRQQLVPLRAEDLRLYLGVMRSAAQRVRHPTTQDIQAVRVTEAWSVVMDTASAMHAPLPAPLDEATLERSSNLTGHMADLQVASERGIDLGRYQWIRGTIEAIVVPSSKAAQDGCGGDNDCSAIDPTARPGLPHDRKALALATLRDRRLISPDLAEIRSLESIVHARNGPATSIH